MKPMGWHYKGFKVEHGQDWFQVICPATSLSDVFKRCAETGVWELTTPSGVTDNWTEGEFIALLSEVQKRGAR